jgi:uncharacterized membrane protein
VTDATRGNRKHGSMREPLVFLWGMTPYLASLGWGMSGLAKVLLPKQAVFAGLTVPTIAVIGAGLCEVVLACAWCLTKLRRAAALTSLVLSGIFGLGILVGLVDPDTCACFGKLQASRSRHLLIVGILTILSSLALISHQERIHEPSRD